MCEHKEGGMLTGLLTGAAMRATKDRDPDLLLAATEHLIDLGPTAVLDSLVTAVTAALEEVRQSAVMAMEFQLLDQGIVPSNEPVQVAINGFLRSARPDATPASDFADMFMEAMALGRNDEVIALFEDYIANFASTGTQTDRRVEVIKAMVFVYKLADTLINTEPTTEVQ